MNPDPLDSLFRAVREDAPDTSRAEYGFETRVMARIRSERRSTWQGWAWRLCPFFTALAVAVSAWFYQHREDAPGGESFYDAVRLAGAPLVGFYLSGDE
jgi:hypothetical protein